MRSRKRQAHDASASRNRSIQCSSVRLRKSRRIVLRRGASSSTELSTEADRLSALKSLSFFAGFEDDDLREVLRFTTWQRHPADTVLIAEQQANHGFFVLVRGQARVAKNGTLLRLVE